MFSFEYILKTNIESFRKKPTSHKTMISELKEEVIQLKKEGKKEKSYSHV